MHGREMIGCIMYKYAIHGRYLRHLTPACSQSEAIEVPKSKRVESLSKASIGDQCCLH